MKSAGIASLFQITILSLGFIPLLASCGSKEIIRPSTDLVIESQGAAWLAYQDGEGDWQVLNPDAAPALELATELDSHEQDVLEHLTLATAEGQTVTVEDSDGRYGVARVCLDKDGHSDLSIYYYTLKERTTLIASCIATTGSEESYTISGTIAGLAQGESAKIAIGSGNMSVTSANNSFVLETRKNPFDVIVASYPQGSSQPNRLAIFGNQTASDNQNLNLDLSSALGLLSQNASLTNVRESDRLDNKAALLTPNGSTLLLAQSDTKSFSHGVLPLSINQLVFYDLSTSALDYNSSTGAGVRRSVRRIFAQGEAEVLNLPEGFASISISATIPFSPVASWQAHQNAKAYRLFYYQPSQQVFVLLSKAYLGDEPSYSYSLPDFSKLENWQNWQLAPSQLDWSFYIREESGTPNQAGFESIYVQSFGKLKP